MGFLHFLESLRSEPLDLFFGAVTYLGDEVVFIAIALVIFWCYNKRCAYYVFIAGFFGLIFNQILKILCKIPRPWVLDPTLTIVESARARAEGYSFPSGHTQDIVGAAGAFLMLNRKHRWAWFVCIALLIVVPFSRLYLGVHTPLDVGVGFLISAAVVLALYPVFRTNAKYVHFMPFFFIGIFALTAFYLFYVLGWVDPAELDGSNYASAVKNGWLMLGCLGGLILSYFVDHKWLHFREEAKWYAQIAKFALGFALLLGIRTVLKAPLYALIGSSAADAIRYFIIVSFAGCVWPLTFPFFAKAGKKRRHSDAEN